MVTVILVVLTIVLLLAAAAVGLLLLRRSRSTGRAGGDRPTVGDLVRRRSAPSEDLTDLSGSELFTPTPPKTAGAAAAPAATHPGEPDAGRPVEVSVPQPTLPSAATPPGGVEAGDAPWRRAARMMGSEPGGRWETAPLPVVPASADPAAGSDAARSRSDGADGAGSGSARPPSPPAPPPNRDAVPDGPEDAGRTAVIAVPAQGGVPAPAPEPAAAPTPAVAPEPDRDEAVRVPAGPALTLTDATLADATLTGATLTDATPPEATEPAEAVAPRRVGLAVAAPLAAPQADDPGVSDRPSRPLSDPEMTPLMGIPVVRPLAAEPTPRPRTPRPAPSPAAVSPAAVSPVVASPDAPSSVVVSSVVVSSAAASEPDPVAAVADPTVAVPAPAVPPSARRPAVVSDDEVVWMQPSGTRRDERPPVVTGSPQPVWFRVVRRDGEPVGGTVVSLLDDHGREADATKTATDGGGELHAPHGGRFLMIASADGFQPRAALLTVDEQPVEIALLLPRSARVAGAVLIGGGPAAGARVVARQEGEVVDEIVTDPDGGYRFDDLAEGAYALTAVHGRGSAMRLVTLSEGADERLDLDLTPLPGAP